MYKAELPEGLRIAMKLTESQFEELEVNAFQAFINFASAMADLDALPEEPSVMEVAFRPSHNPNEQYFAIELSMMVDPPTGGGRMEVASFKPMDRKEYIAYCIKEFGEAPVLSDPQLN